ncbi:GPI-anchored protein LLG1-like [Argentina anserina]|uniref:GPI-anchored protein LLG1-like n=1 Tax=Argentina anserina TaxID=57926 RepID=UPI0021766A12|nr:GPI-anchored protein LLG1-like [Potentilla anserina]
MITYSYRSSCHYLVFFFLLILLCLASTSSSATFLPNHIFDPPRGPFGRSLLQTQKTCPVNFENQNYTILTSKCKGPNYPPKICCEALKEFACPFAEQVSDEKSDCATTMFSYINIYGKYPPGLFASQCKEDNKIGLECADAEPPKPSSSKASPSAAHVALAAAIILLSLHFL